MNKFKPPRNGLQAPRNQQYPNTAEVRGYETMRKELDGDVHDRLRGGQDDSDLSSRASLEFYNDDLMNSYSSYHRHGRHESQENLRHGHKGSFNSSYESPHRSNKTSFTSQDLRLPLRAPSQQDSHRSKLGDIPEAWLVFPNGDGRHTQNGFLTERAVPVNLANSIGSRLQVRSSVNGTDRQLTSCPLQDSFSNIKTLRKTPVESLISEDIKEESKGSRNKFLWAGLICLGVILLVLVIIGIVYAAIPRSGSGSSSLVARLGNQGVGQWNFSFFCLFLCRSL